MDKQMKEMKCVWITSEIMDKLKIHAIQNKTTVKKLANEIIKEALK